jgi:predicted transcriptional regulator
MKQSNEDLAENKVLILYILNKLTDGTKSDNLFKIVSSANDINYFYFQELLTDLIDTNLVGSFTKDEDEFIKITSEGQNALSLTKSLLPGILKLKADNVFKEEFSTIVEESSIITEYVPKSENNYTVKCKIVEKNEIIFEVSIFAGSRERAKQISDNWKSNAEKTYPKILDLLLNGDKIEK